MPFCLFLVQINWNGYNTFMQNPKNRNANVTIITVIQPNVKAV